MIHIALTGNPNAGKTTLFNNLTGSNQHVGNWPGKTVERKDGTINIDDQRINIIDLPGTYSLTSFSAEETVTRDYIIKERPDIVIDVIDATNLQRNLYLALELLELNTNLILAINMDKFAKRKGIDIDTKKIEELLNIPVIKVDAKNKEEARTLISLSLGHKKKSINVQYGKELEEHLQSIESSIKINIGKIENYSTRWLAVKLIEQDTEIIEKIAAAKNGKAILEELERIIPHLRVIFGRDFDTIVSDKRYGFAAGIIKAAVKRPQKDKFSFSDSIDRLATNRYLGIPLFLIVMYALFQLTFTLAQPIVTLIGHLVSWLGINASALLSALNSPEWVSSLMADGIIGGLGSIIVFLPNIFVLFFIISLLEDSGYLARAAYIMDNLMHKIGLHGKSFIPLILGFGCNVPAIMATRSLDNKKDRILTILINPFMSCSARLPVYLLFIGAFFTRHQGIILFSLYLLGIILAVLSGLLFKKIFFKGLSSEFIMELPPYRIPTIKGALIHMWERGKMFLYKAGTLIFLFVLAAWFLSNLPFGVEYASEQSFIGIIGKALAPLLAPLGFGNWQTAVALLFGVAAKEVVISTIGTLYGVSEAALTSVLQNIFTPLSAYAFMVMTLIYIPCIATIAVIKKETGTWKWALFSVAYSIILGWVMAFIVYQGGLLLGLK